MTNSELETRVNTAIKDAIDKLDGGAMAMLHRLDTLGRIKDAVTRARAEDLGPAPLQ